VAHHNGPLSCYYEDDFRTSCWRCRTALRHRRGAPVYSFTCDASASQVLGEPMSEIADTSAPAPHTPSFTAKSFLAQCYPRSWLRRRRERFISTGRPTRATMQPILTRPRDTPKSC
jgi:hypothetical protein